MRSNFFRDFTSASYGLAHICMEMGSRVRMGAELGDVKRDRVRNLYLNSGGSWCAIFSFPCITILYQLAVLQKQKREILNTLKILGIIINFNLPQNVYIFLIILSLLHVFKLFAILCALILWEHVLRIMFLK